MSHDLAYSHYGVDVPPKSVAVSDGAPNEFECDGVVKVLVLRKPDVPALVDWESRYQENCQNIIG